MLGGHSDEALRNAQEPQAQQYRRHRQPGYQADPHAHRPLRRDAQTQTQHRAQRHADAPVSECGDQHRHAGVLQAAQSTDRQYLHAVRKLERRRQQQQSGGQRNHRRVAGVERSDGLVAEQQGRAGDQLGDQHQGQTRVGGPAQAVAVAAPQRMADPHRGGFGQCHRHHETQAGDIDRDLMRGRRHFAQPADHQRGGDEQAALHQPGNADRQPQHQQAADHRPLRRFVAIQQLQVGEPARAGQISGHPQRLQPHHQRRSEPQPARTQRRQAAQPEGQRVTHWHQHHQSAEAQHHRGNGEVQPITEVAHAQEQRQRGDAPADAVDEIGRTRANLRRDTEALQRQRNDAEKREHGQAQRQRQPHRLAEQWPDLVPPPAAVQLRDRGRHCDQSAHRQQQRQPEQRGADRHRCERGGAVAAGDHRIDQTDQPGRDVPGDQRCGEARAAAQFVAETRSRRGMLKIV